jgi:HEAT repeat protein
VKIVAALHHEEDLRRALVALAADDDRHVRATVIKTLGILEDEDAIRTLLEAATDPDRRVVANSVEAIEDMGREELAGLVRILAVHPNNRIRANAVKALWTLGDTTESGRMLDEMLRSGDEMMRLSATWVLGEIDHPARTELLTRIAGNDPSERVRVKAMGILG